MKKILKRSFCVLAVPVIVACNSDPTGAKSLEAAKGFLTQGETKAATIELKNTLQKDAANREARWLLGKVYLSSGDYQNAVKELERALDLGQSQDDILPLLAESYLAMGDRKKLESLAIENLVSEDARSTLLAAQGLGVLGTGNVEQAGQLIGQSVAESPTNVFAMVAQVRIDALKAKGEYDGVRQQLGDVLEIDPGYAPALSLLGDVELQSSRLNLAEQAYSQAINAGSKNLEDYYKRALVRLQMGDVKGTEQDINALAQRVPSHPGVHYLKGLIYFQQQNYKDAITSFEVASKAESRYPMSLLYLGLANNVEGHLTQAEDYAYRFLSIVPDSAPGRRLLAGLKLKAGDSNEAEELLAPVIAQNPDDVNALNLLAKAYTQQGRREDATELLSKIAKIQPDSAEARLRLGASLMALGQEDIGLEQIQTAGDLNPELQQADKLIVAAHVRDGDFEGALKAVDKFEEKNPNSAEAYNLRGQVQLAAGDDDAARSSFENSLKVEPGNLSASHSLAFLAVKNDQMDKARAYYSNALEHHENDLSILLKLIALEEIDKKPKAMLGYMEQGLKAHPDSLYLKVLMARYYITEGRPEQVLIVLGDLDSAQRNLPDVVNVIGLSQIERGKFLEAKGTFEKLQKLSPNAPQPRYHLGKALLGLGDNAGAASEFRAALENSPAYLAPRIELTRLAITQRNRDEVNSQLKLLKEIAADHHEVVQLEASKYRLDGDQQKALELSALAFEQAPSTRNLLILARQKLGMGDAEGSSELLNDWIDQYPQDVSARLELANLYVSSGDETLAVEQYKSVLGVDKANLLAMNNLAWLLRDSDTDLALEYAEQVVESSPNSAEAMDTLAVVQLKSGTLQKAQRSIERALALKPKSPDVRYHSAQILAALGDKSRAKQVLQELLDEGVDFSEKNDAEAFLNTL